MPAQLLVITRLAASLSAAAMALALPSMSSAQDLPPPMPQAAPMPPPPAPAPPLVDIQPAWYGGAMVDPRAREAWLGECRHRLAYYYHGNWEHHGRHKRHDHHEGFAPRYDYCEAYFDDYYRYYSQVGSAYAYGYQGQAMRQMMMPMHMERAQSPTEEVVSEEYVPIRTRIIPRRPAPRRDKRVRVY